MHLCLFEDARVAALFPLTRTRSTYDLRLGMRTLLQATRDAFEDAQTLLHARPLIRTVTAEENGLPAPRQLPDDADVLFINGRFIAGGEDSEGQATLEAIRNVVAAGEGRAFVTSERGQTILVAAYLPRPAPPRPATLLQQAALGPEAFADLPETALRGAPLVSGLPDLLDARAPALRRDFEALTQGGPIRERPGAHIQEGARLVAGERVFAAPGATVRPGAVVSGEDGPVFIGANAVVMENAVVRGPACVGPRSMVKPGTHVENSTLGMYCKVGGEVEGTTLHSFSNKAHGGFLGDSYLGRWCNLGADTIISNLKNDYGEIALWNGATGEIEDSGRQFAGLFMGDHSKCSIGMCFNTGSVVDVFVNLFGPGGFPPRYVPPFSWGRPQDGFSEEGFTAYRLEKALRVAEIVMARRDHALTEAQRRLLTRIAEERA